MADMYGKYEEFLGEADVDRLLSKVRFDESGCWQWTAATHHGYGRFGVRAGLDFWPVVPAHRASYVLLHGPIPCGLVLDHLCRNRGCVNPDHLEPVTHQINILRGNGAPARHATKTHCIHGHPFDEANTYIKANGGRDCRTCNRERVRELRRG